MSTIAEGTPPPPSSSPPPRASIPGGGPPRPDEPDLLAERRIRRGGEAGEQALLRRAEAAEATVKTLEAHVASLQQRLSEAERGELRTTELAERLDRVESALDAIRDSHRRMALTIGELREVALRLRVLGDREPAPTAQPIPRPTSQPVAQAASDIDAGVAPRREEMAQALAAAVERLRARAQETPVDSVVAEPATEPIVRKPHKHSMSLIGRLRRARKQRREGR